MSVNINVFPANEIYPTEWLELMDLARTAGASEQNRNDTELSASLGLHDAEHFVKAHRDPNIDSGNFSPLRMFFSPRLALATDGKEKIGYAYSADYVVGDKSYVRDLRYASFFGRLLDMREVVVRPDYQRQGIGTALTRILLEKAYGVQPVSTAITSGEVLKFYHKLSGLGFRPVEADEVPDRLNSLHVRKITLMARNVRNVLRQLNERYPKPNSPQGHTLAEW